MISCAPRLKKDSGPTWKSVSIHWTDSDMNRLVPVDGLPWIRTTDKAKLFNKNGPLRVVATYRTTDGVDPKTEYRHVSMIADAIEQYVLVRIVMPKEVSAKPGADWPKFRVWAFLQPPIIGRDKKRRDANGGYVVDDIPRAGWFEAVVDGKTMTAEEIDYSKGHKSPAGKKPLKVTGERDASDPRVVRFKICARVANNESEAELKEKAQKLRKKNQDVSLVEAGSYLKVWVRNEERTWPQKPLDDDSEKIVQSMADADSIKPGSGTDPRKFRNHTWKRSRLATHKNIAKGKEPDKNLLYVGLYPAHVIEKIEKFETKIASNDSREINPFAWIATMILWSLLVKGLSKSRDELAKKFPKVLASGNGSARMNASKKIVALVTNAQLSELFAGYAVAGFKTFTDIPATLEAAQVHQASWFNTTKMLMNWIFKYGMLSDDLSKAEHELEKLIEEIDKELAKTSSKSAKWKKVVPEKVLACAQSWKDLTTSITVSPLELKGEKTIPKIPKPLPLPGLWWLSYYLKLAGEAGLNVKFSINASKWDKDELVLGIEGAGTGKGSITVGLQAIWAKLTEDMADEEKKKSGGPESEMLQQIAGLINVELSLKVALEALAKMNFEWTIKGKSDKRTVEFTKKPGFTGTFNCPLEFKISVFQWSYDTFNGTLVEMKPTGASFLKNVIAFKVPKNNWLVTQPWGKSNYDTHIYTLPGGQDHRRAITFGAIIPMYLPYSSAVNPEKCTASIQLLADVPLDLASGIATKNQPASKQDGSGEVYAPVRLTWNPTPSKDPGVVSLFGMYASKWDKLQIALSALSSEERTLAPIITTPEDETPQLSPKSSITLLSPKARPTRFQAVTHAPKGLLFEYDMDFYMDSHIWVKLCEGDTIYDDVCKLRGRGKNDWRLYPIQGAAALHSKCSIFIPMSDIQSIGNKETAYQFYLKLALLDDDGCEIKNVSSMRLTVPDPTYRMLQTP